MTVSLRSKGTRLIYCLQHTEGISLYLLLQHAVEDEDEHSLQRIEDGEQVRHDHRALVDVHKTKGPGEAQQTQQGDGTNHPGSGTKATVT